MTYKFIRIFLILPFLMVIGCSDPWEEDFAISGNNKGVNHGYREETPESRKVLLLYSAGNNSLRNYLLEDINDLKQGWLPGNRRGDDVLLVYTHTPVRSGNYSTPTTPHLIKLYKNAKGETISDTLKTYESGTISSSATQLAEVLKHVKTRFPAASYGLLFSSHATGYLPAGYYLDPGSYQYKESGEPDSGIEDVPSVPMERSIGQDKINSESHEIDLKDFAREIPFKLDYILFDCCLMGGIEVAYELRNKCDRMGFSQAEVMAEGFDYKALTTHLLQAPISDPQAVCEDFFAQYQNQSGVYRSATISLVNTAEMDSFATVCSQIFAKYRNKINALTTDKVQGFGGTKKYFFDLEDIVIQAGADGADIKSLQEALDKIIAYKNTTGQYYSATDSQTHAISIFSGLSMYIPGCGNDELKKYYRTLGWNQATGLVE